MSDECEMMNEKQAIQHLSVIISSSCSSCPSWLILFFLHERL